MMDCKSIIERSKALPFHGCSFFTISQLFISNKDKMLEKLEDNNFSKNMIDLMNGISKNNYTCGYFEEEGIHKLSKKHVKDSLKIYHGNIESFSKNGTNLNFFLHSLKINFDIICLTETRSTNIGIVDKVFPEYHIYLDNPTTSKGGVALLLRKNKFKQITELNTNANFNLKNKCVCKKCLIENVWLSFKINNQKVILGGIYRHPHGESDHFNAALRNTISKIEDNTLAIVLGDINIDLLKEDDAKRNNYLNNFFEFNFIPGITLPTRITHHSATLLDHIFIKTPKKLIQNKCSSGNLITDISDHLSNFSIIDIKAPYIKDRPFIRLFTQKNIDKFNESISSEQPLITPNEITDTDTSFDILSKNYLNLFDKYFPYVKMSKKESKNKPHITKGIKISIRTRNKLYKKYINNPTEVNKAAWKRFRNKTNEMIKRAESLYYKSILNKHNNSSKNLWSTFGKILNNKKIKHNKISSLNINDERQTEPNKIAESFNKFFSEIGENLAKKFPNDCSGFKNYLTEPAINSMLLSQTYESEITKIIKSLKNTNSTGYDNFSTKFIKLSSSILAPALTKMFNISIKAGIYPSNLKIAKVIPIFKKGDPSSVNNYRPISILSPINKIFEKILYSRLTIYIHKSNLLYK